MTPRTILYTGKGGVGKTSVAAATARRCAAAGLETVVLSTDPAHSLGDVLEASLGPSVERVGDRLWAQEVSAQDELERTASATCWGRRGGGGGRGGATAYGRRRSPRRTSSSATGARCRSGSARCSSSAGSTASRPRSSPFRREWTSCSRSCRSSATT